MRSIMDYVEYCVKYGTTFFKNVITAPTVFSKIQLNSISEQNIQHSRLFNSHIIGMGTPDKERHTFYLKVYRDDDIAIACIQSWLEVINYFDNPDVYIVCDSMYLKMRIMNKCKFPDNGDVTFIKSRINAIKKVCEDLHSKSIRWRNATYAHVIPFYHAQKNGIIHHWDLDADDTMFLIQPDLVAKILKTAEQIAEHEIIDAFSLDMWKSRTQGKYWTFGVLYISGSTDFYSFFKNNPDKSWMKRYEQKKLEKFYNTDWYFTYLKDEGLAKVEAFYVENCLFSHWGANCLMNPIYGAVYKWQDDFLRYPIIDEYYKDEDLEKNKIIDCVKIDIGLHGSESCSFLRNKFGRLSDYEKRRFGLPNHD